MDTPSAAAGHEARVVEAGRGWAWWTDAWALFTQSALLWVALAVILIVGFGVIGMVPFLGAVATSLLTPVFIGSWLLAARKVQGGGALEVADLFTCFKGDRFTPLLVIGALLLAVIVVIGVVAGVLGAGAMFGMAASGAHRSMGGMMAAAGAGFVAVAVLLVLGVVISMAVWFAPALVVFHNVPPVDALRASTLTVLKNWLPCLVYGLIYIAAAVVASIPFALGWIVLAPVLLLTMYTSYQDVYGA